MPTPCPDEVGPPFTAPCDDIPVEWVEVTSIHDDLVPTGSPELQFRLFANRFKSSSPDCEYFLHDPLRHMLLKPGALKSVDWWPDESRINNEPIGSRPSAFCSMTQTPPCGLCATTRGSTSPRSSATTIAS